MTRPFTMVLFLATAVLLGGIFLWPFLAKADFCRDQWGQSAPQYDWNIWSRNIQRENDGRLEQRTMTETERFRFLWTYNSSPPVTDRNPERIEIFWLRGAPTVIVVFVEDGCVTVTAGVLRALLESIISPNETGI